jgi:ubiquitin-like protein Pup
MSEQTQKTTSSQDDEPQDVEVVQHDVSEITDAVDDLLDDIDDVLEENAQEFVAAFVQKGGE